MTLKTALHSWHQNNGAKLVPFGGWDMPVNYGSQIDEHVAVRTHCGLFDVSHMAVVDLAGDDVYAFLRYLLANDVAKLKEPGAALYSCMLNESAGIIDDLIAYHIDATHFRLVVNAGTAEGDIAWMLSKSADFDVSIQRRVDLAMIAVQGPAAPALVAKLGPSWEELTSDLRVFHARWNNVDQFAARTGYTGEDGFEIIMPAVDAESTWAALVQAGATPCGLGARDTLRLEAGMNLYGQDMNTDIRPYECGLSWTVALSDDRDFIGKRHVTDEPRFVQSGIILQDRGVLRSHQPLSFPDGRVGEITSGTFSPTMKQSIGFARVPVGSEPTCRVEIRGRELSCELVKLPFVRRGKILL